MRKIKFRGKDYMNKWRIGDLVQEKWGQGIAIMIKKNKTAWSVLEDTVGQYTGLKDKNGKEIYEGDIVLYEDWEMATENGRGDMFINKGIIEYNESNCCFNITEKQTIDNSDVLFEDTDCIEVIGNIYDNKELLNN
ncbi:MAG: hypothetical protein HFJ49_03080 [Clostridia bacterium]|nr:hypothetical protein [Clostridia bacterium]